MPLQLPPHHYALIRALLTAPDGAGAAAAPGAALSFEELAARAGMDQSLVSAAATELAAQGWLELQAQNYTELKLGELGTLIGAEEAELPERRLARVIRGLGGSASIKDLGSNDELSLAGIQAGKFARNLAELGWASFEGGALSLSGEAAGGEPAPTALETALDELVKLGGKGSFGEPRDSEIAALARGRKELLSSAERTRRSVAPAAARAAELKQMWDAGEITEAREANELTPEMLADGSWRDVQFRAYDVTLAAETPAPGKAHPLVRLIEEVRLAFLELGFSEASCPMAETAFWDFDALFQPQDHPAREMQDTFYVGHPASYPLPEAYQMADGSRLDVVDNVKRAHEDGGDTGGRGWRYQWSEKRASQVVLRTHMTASSIHALAKICQRDSGPQNPYKVFSIGRVFRRETVDFKHLPEFTQVDGIIVDQNASLSSLMGTLRKFYERMGIEDVMLKPDFFPYTEPSVGVLVKWEGRWLEMGGAGIFRPEVTLPLGCTAPVLAWGLGLERLAMLRFGLTAIKDLYLPKLDFLKGARITG
ncbi:phenylalanine--tRNA ligase subunit alpha [bacterium]|nr:phenylalanine--tRNA ligase subunit alpha [bacterium]